MGLSIRRSEILGAEIRGVDLSKPLSAEDRASIEEALNRNLVVVARDQRLSDPELLAFSLNFGELDPPGPNPYGEPFNKQYPEINVISNVIENGRPIGGLGAGEASWHADMTYIEVPPKAAVLHALEIPPAGGGNTYFADMFAAYEGLPPDLKAAIEGKLAVHDASRNSAGFLRKGYAEVSDPRQTVGARHPLVRTDARTGRRALSSAAATTATSSGWSLPKARRCSMRSGRMRPIPRFAMCHEWRVGDVLMWNNLAVLHRRDPFDENASRVMHRTQIKGAERIA